MNWRKIICFVKGHDMEKITREEDFIFAFVLPDGKKIIANSNSVEYCTRCYSIVFKGI